ncbi:MAG: WecB/TagA/CpsF family glycosyltransferase [Sedimentisphaerales bacterium]|nr:WecB/TagA/CpsF family glycosyltransferase [Sedimentisphaerales bacterium]
MAIRYKIINTNFDFIEYDEVLQRILGWRLSKTKYYITLTNPHSIFLSFRETDMRNANRDAALTLPDGIGIIVAAYLLGYPRCRRVTGPGLMLYLCDHGRKYGLRHFFYGGQRGVAGLLADRLQEKYDGLRVAGTYCPPFRELSPKEDFLTIEIINSTKPDIVWVGLGAPKQEKWMLHHWGKITSSAMIGVGAAFDFHSGNVSWAPRWIRSSGLEWAYRLLLEPRRMWRRNLDSPLFMFHVLRQRLTALMYHNEKVSDGRI